MNIIQAYAPMTQFAHNDIIYSTGDFNAKVGKGQDDGVVGKYGLRCEKDRGEKMVQFCKEFGFVLINTLFELLRLGLNTWRPPADNDNHIFQNQIDYMLVAIVTSLKEPRLVQERLICHNMQLCIGRLRLKQLKDELNHKNRHEQNER